MASTLPGYAYSYFLPIILKSGMGFNTTQSQLLSAPPYILAAIMAVASGWLGDRLRIRGPIIACHQGITAVGMILTAFGPNNAVRYFGTYIGMLSIKLPLDHRIIGLNRLKASVSFSFAFQESSPSKPTTSLPIPSEPSPPVSVSLEVASVVLLPVLRSPQRTLPHIP